MQTDKMVLAVLAVVAVVAIGYMLYVSNTPSNKTSTSMPPPMKMPVEAFQNGTQAAPADQVSVSSGINNSTMPTMSTNGMVDASDTMGMNEQPQGLMINDNTMQINQLPSECYPKDVLSSADLLPRDANSLWAQVNPSGQGSLADQNFLTAGFHIGINTVGQTLRNANRQLRSEPLNPQVKVSPWMQTTIEPDINRRPLEIQGDL
jgi:hypothetical protein